jgi:hypothetical protein
MRPVCVFANGSDSEIDLLRASLRGRWRQAARAVMVLLSLHGLSAAPIAVVLDVTRPRRRWIGRFSTEGWPGWPSPLRQIHGCFRNRSTGQLLATAAPWTSPWLPPGYEQNFWNAALSYQHHVPITRQYVIICFIG